MSLLSTPMDESSFEFARGFGYFRCMADLLCSLRDLSVVVDNGDSHRSVVRDISFDIRDGEIVVLVGESGSGKTTLARALTRLFPQMSGLVVRGAVLFKEESLLDCTAERLQEIRRRHIRYVFQDPMLFLDPLQTVRSQLIAASPGGNITDGLLGSVGLDDGVLKLFPHQLSTGMAQRVAIAMALQASPDLIIADEPTSAVDASLKNRLLNTLVEARRERGMSLLLITHDLGIARQCADGVIVLYQGQVVEKASCKDFFARPLHPYSQILIETSLSKR